MTDLGDLCQQRQIGSGTQAYQALSDKTKLIVKEDACMKFYNEINMQYLETDASRVGVGASLLQTRESTNCSRVEAPDNSIWRPITFMCKSFSATKRHSNLEREELGIYVLETFPHYHFAREVSIITNMNLW